MNSKRLIAKKALKKLVKVVFILCPLGIVGLYLAFYSIMVLTEDHWLEDEPFHDSIDQVVRSHHKVKPLDTGWLSLGERLRTIELAEETIDLEFFIYELDSASRLITNALIQKARQGVKVRLLVDFSFAVLELRPAYAHLLEREGISVKYYNTAPLARFFAVQHRTHRKLLIVDDKRVILGGRNVGNDYFDLSEKYNFLDSDLLIEGNIVHPIQDSFDLYWNSKWAIPSDYIVEKNQETVIDLSLNGSDLKILDDLVSREIILSPSFDCGNMLFVTDYPGSGVNYRKVFREISESVKFAKKEIFVESPYFILRDDGLELLREISQSKVKISILTNSLASTDAYYTVAAMFPDLAEMKIEHFKLYAYSGEAPESYEGKILSERWGVHSKRAVIDEKTVLLGTYNLDPRSANLNSELMVACYDSVPLAQYTKQSILKRIAQSNLVVDGNRVNQSLMLKGASLKSIFAMFVVMPVASLFNFLL